MESFDIGNHVVVELEDDRKIAGYIVGVNDDGSGLILKATHKETAMLRSINPDVSADIERQLMEKSMWSLRLTGVLHRVPLLALLDRVTLVSAVQRAIEAHLIEEREDGVQLRELSVPVLTYINTGFVRLMEDTDDKLTESEVSVFNQTMDISIEKLFTEEDVRKASEAAVVDEVDGKP